MVDFGRRHFAEVSLDEEIDVRQDDKWWSKSWTRMILHYKIIALKLPVYVTALLNFREGIAAETDTKVRKILHPYRQMDRMNRSKTIAAGPLSI